MSENYKIAALEAKVAALEAKAEKAEKAAEPEKPFVPKPYQRWDPTANMSMPPSALREMVNAVPDNFMQDVVRDNRAPTGRPGMIPDQPTASSHVRPAGGGASGWVHEVPISSPPGMRWVDAQLDEQDRRDRAELARKLGKP